MGPPGGGRNPVTARLTRHFNFLAFTEMEDPSKRKIFATILKSWISKFKVYLMHFLYFQNYHCCFSEIFKTSFTHGIT